MPKEYYAEDELTPTQQYIVDKLRQGYTLTKNQRWGATLHGNGHGPDEQVSMRSVNGLIARGRLDKKSLRLTEVGAAGWPPKPSPQSS